ncbi:hypothetical protein ABZ478_05060 [Streptomyces sp. NPDC005706]|uniref:hypothetical protein n=1 Tax=Streptomyces sp. NPDC005706 TaxID=3157169 RepID=UPI0033FA6D29
MTDPGQGGEGAGRFDHNNLHGPSGVQVGPNGQQFNANPNINIRQSGFLLPAVCVAALVGGAVFAVMALAPWKGSSQGAAPPPDSVASRGPDVTAPAQDSPSEQAAVSSPTTAAAAAGPVRWQGEINIGMTGVDLDSLPPSQSTDDSYDAALYSSSDALMTNQSGAPDVAAWPGPGTPSRKQCADQLATHGGFMAQAADESVLCVRTRTGRVAALTITSMGDVFTAGTAKVIVWEAKDQ